MGCYKYPVIGACGNMRARKKELAMVARNRWGGINHEARGPACPAPPYMQNLHYVVKLRQKQGNIGPRLPSIVIPVGNFWLLAHSEPAMVVGVVDRARIKHTLPSREK